jgi:copper(I)-binding protein
MVISSHPENALIAPTLAMHVLLGVAWLGSFWPLRRLLAAEGPAAAPAVGRFSALAVPAVPVLMAAGLVIAVAAGAVSVDTIAGSRYGLLLLSKLVLVVTMLGLAAWNRLWLAPALGSDDGDAVRRLLLSVGAEATLGLGALAVTAVLSLAPPPRAAAHAGDHAHHHDAAGRMVAGAASGVLAVVSVSPAKPGPNHVEVSMSRGGSPFDPLEATLLLSRDLATGDAAALSRPMRRAATGVWTWDGPELAFAGRWRLRVEALVSDFELAAPTVEVDLGGAPAAVDESPRMRIEATGGFARATRSAGAAASVYVSLHNANARSDRLLGASSHPGTSVSLHTSVQGADGIARMRALDAVFLPASGSAALLPDNGLHLMVEGLTAPLLEGSGCRSLCISKPLAMFPYASQCCALARVRPPTRREIAVGRQCETAGPALGPVPDSGHCAACRGRRAGAASDPTGPTAGAAGSDAGSRA